MEDKKETLNQHQASSGTESKTESALRSKIRNGKINWGLMILIGGCIWALVEIIRVVLYFFN